MTLCDIAHFKQANVAGQSLYNLLLVADRALNQAKAQGRNRVGLHTWQASMVSMAP
ncbi:hypothetical protein GWQ22_12655 [Aeromonas sp. 1HA1]|nr:hypothetical protein [Aeromonas sp. 1HA1]